MELRQTIAQLQVDIHNLEKNISSLTMTYDDLVEQCRNLREQQTDQNKEILLQQSEKDFQQYIQDIENYIQNKQWKTSSIGKPPISGKIFVYPTDYSIWNFLSLASQISPSLETTHQKIEELPIQTLHDDLNQQLASVENWLMASAITSHDKSSPILIENPSKDDGTDDLYKDLILPTLSEEIQFDENHHHHQQQNEEFVKTMSPDNSKQQRLDKSQRRFVLMRQLAGKSNKTVTKKLLWS